MKFTLGDTVYIKQHFAFAFSDSLKSGKSYYALIKSSEKYVLDSFLFKTDFKNLDSVYYESYADGEEYAFYIENDSINKRIYVHSHSVPISLKEFGSWTIGLKNNLVYFPIDTVINFGSARNFLLPKIEPPPIILKTP
jgi:hypothetical protein